MVRRRCREGPGASTGCRSSSRPTAGRTLSSSRPKSGIWFHDARRSTNHPYPLRDWYTPEGLKELLKQDVERANQQLKVEPTDGLGLRDYQVAAIKAVEAALEDGRRQALVAMATGTGKTRTFIGLIYRLVKTARFRRVLFLVDRTSLGEQAKDAFKTRVRRERADLRHRLRHQGAGGPEGGAGDEAPLRHRAGDGEAAR